MPKVISYRLHTLEELRAWASYPLREHILRGTLQDAVRWHRKHFDGNSIEEKRASECRAVVVARKRRLSALPDMCYRHEHPVRCGRPGKLYGKHDRIDPIIDALTMMYDTVRGGRSACDALGLFSDQPEVKRQRGNRQRDGYDEQEDAEERSRQTAHDVRCGKLNLDTRWSCEHCGNNDLVSIVASGDGSCQCGVVVPGVLIDGGEEWRCHADDGAEKNDAKKRADLEKAPRLPNDIENGPPPASERKAERGKQRAAAGKATGIHTGSGMGRGLAEAQKIIERGREREMRARSELSDREELKRTRILEELEKMFRKLKPIDNSVCKEVRRRASDLWLSAVRHAAVCTLSSCCELRLVDRSPFIIASSVFSLTIDAIIGGSVRLETLEREHLIDLQMRMQRSSEFNNASSLTQMATAKRMIDLMQESQFCASTPCTASVTPATQTGPTTSAALIKQSLLGVMVQRTDSSLTNSGDDSPSGGEDQLPLRHAVAQVFLAHRSELPISVKDGAVRALGSPGFVVGCQQLGCLKAASLQATAFCVLNAVAREQARAVGPLFARGACFDQLDVPIAQKLRLDLAVAEEAIEAIRHLVPIDAASEASATHSGDLFV